MNALYNFGIGTYRTAAKLVATRSPKVKKMIDGQKRTLAIVRDRLGDGGCDLWVHAASLGEFEQARPMIERLRRERPEMKILLTFFSPSGYEVRKNYDKVDCVTYLPFDSPRRVKRFLDVAKPRMAVFVKYEFWGNYLQQLAARGVPTYIISAIFRPGQIFFKPWGGMFRKMLSRFDHLYLQDEASRQLLESICVTNTTVAGDTRFDRVTDVMAQTFEIPGSEHLHPFIIFGSSWPADEERYMPWLRQNPDVKFIIAPHEFDDERIAALVSAVEGRVVTLSEWEKMAAENPAELDSVRGVVVDSFGKLSSLYRYGRMAYIGGGFGVGIHNINEAAVYGMPVVFGPNFHKFREAKELIKVGGGFTVSDEASTAEILSRLHTDADALAAAGKSAGDFIRDNLGATDKIYSDIF